MKMSCQLLYFEVLFPVVDVMFAANLTLCQVFPTAVSRDHLGRRKRHERLLVAREEAPVKDEHYGS